MGKLALGRIDCKSVVSEVTSVKPEFYVLDGCT